MLNFEKWFYTNEKLIEEGYRLDLTPTGELKPNITNYNKYGDLFTITSNPTRLKNGEDYYNATLTLNKINGKLIKSVFAAFLCKDDRISAMHNFKNAGRPITKKEKSSDGKILIDINKIDYDDIIKIGVQRFMNIVKLPKIDLILTVESSSTHVDDIYFTLIENYNKLDSVPVATVKKKTSNDLKTEFSSVSPNNLHNYIKINYISNQYKPTNSQDLTAMINAIIDFANKNSSKPISVATDLKIANGGIHLRNEYIKNYFKLPPNLNISEYKNILILDDNVNFGTTIFALTDMINTQSPETDVYWFILLFSTESGISAVWNPKINMHNKINIARGQYIDKRKTTANKFIKDILIPIYECYIEADSNNKKKLFSEIWNTFNINHVKNINTLQFIPIGMTNIIYEKLDNNTDNIKILINNILSINKLNFSDKIKENWKIIESDIDTYFYKY